jgi:F-type H+-transporting ATPase subunit gamma
MSGQLKETRNRISSVKSTQQITKAMKLVAAAKLRKAQERIVKMRPYATKLYDILGNLVAASEGEIAIAQAQERPVEKVLLIALTSDRGLCGAFNANIAKLVKKTLAEKYRSQYEQGNVTVLTVGKKGYDFLKRENLQFNTDYIDLFTRLSFDNSAEAANYVMQAFENQTYDAIEIVYTKFKNQIVQTAVLEPYLPIQKIEVATDATEQDNSMRPDFMFEPNLEDIVGELVPKILKTQFYRCLLDSNASEQGSRMTAMENATQNAEDLIKDLSILYNRARQAAITTEITEIVSGAAALQG